MRTILLLLVLVGILAVSCEQDDISIWGEGFCMTIGDKVVLKPEDIDYYVLSTHMIYLKGDNSFLKEELYRDSFCVYADGEKIYSGVFQSWVSSFMPTGPVIYTPGIFYADYLLPIEFIQWTDLSGKVNPDPRGDERIVQALKAFGQFQEGLKCELRSVQFASKNKVILQLGLINNDTFNYLYLDPVKMGMGFFHYFTNGLSFWDAKSYKSYSNNVQYIQPVPYNSWEKEWLSVIEKRSEKTIWITYDNFDEIPSGKYLLKFSFPGLSNVPKTELFQGNSRIWMGDLVLSKEISRE
ncbi:MAG: hypothetical protein Q8N05_01110 [Bacteroidota bacterium]|nr:hypothetical protein [Bacteroidota bacterium]